MSLENRLNTCAHRLCINECPHGITLTLAIFKIEAQQTKFKTDLDVSVFIVPCITPYFCLVHIETI